MFIKDGEEDAHIFETGIHSLAVERDHGVSGITDNDCRVREVVGSAFYGYEWQVRSLRERGDEIGRVDEGCHAREMRVKEGRQVLRIGF